VTIGGPAPPGGYPYTPTVSPAGYPYTPTVAPSYGPPPQAPGVSSGGRRRRGVKRWWVFWQSPDDQPRWARPTLLALAALAGLSYAWGLDHAALEPFYGAAARSMSASWHDFFFGAFDPDGTVTVDKLPGALWLQALSLRAFGVNTWAFVLPQVVEGILTVLVLYRAVRRLAGPLAGTVAALVLAASPATVLLNRGNISDSLLILLLVLAADATAGALTTGRLRSLLLAGAWVGLAFQAKMAQAWLVLPALWLAYLVASPARGRRVVHVVAATVVTAVVSLSWMLAVTAVPAHERPYVDGSTNDSVFAQVFDYNGLARFQHPDAYEPSVGPLAPFLQVSLEEHALLNGSTATIGRSWHRLLSGPLGRDIGWLLPASLLGGTAVVVGRRRRPHTDPVRAGCILWGTWLVLHVVAFSDGAYLNSYYTAALSPALAALCGMALSAAWRTTRAGRTDGSAPFATAPPPVAPPLPPLFAAPVPPAPAPFPAPVASSPFPATLPASFPAPADAPLSAPGWVGRVLLGVAVTASAGYALFLIPGTGVPPWLVPVLIAAAVGAVAVLLVSVARRGTITRLASLALVAGTLALLLVPAVASATVVSDGLGPFDTPFQPASVTVKTQTDVRRGQDRAAVVARELAQLARSTRTPIMFLTDTSIVAAPYILASGLEVLPVGGFTGAIPSPTLRQIRIDIAFGRVRLAVVPVHPPGHDPRIVWIRTHCRLVRLDPPSAVRFAVYDCHNTA